YRERVFEAAVPVDATQSRGRGFVDGVLLDGKGRTGGLDWQRARAMLNGRLDKIQSPIEKGRRLLEEAIAVDPSHEEALLYMAYALIGNRRRSLHYFRELLDRHPARVSEVAELFARSPKLREAIDTQTGFPEDLVKTCPELFTAPVSPAGDDTGSEEG